MSDPDRVTRLEGRLAGAEQRLDQLERDFAQAVTLLGETVQMAGDIRAKIAGDRAEIDAAIYETRHAPRRARNGRT